MSDAFDPYYKWLGIPPDEQPPNHYRLLGLKRYEADADVISNAADQRMILLRTFQTGKHGGDSQRLLNEVSKARLTLLSKDKSEYDADLRREEAARRREREASRQALKASRSGPLATKTSAKPTVKPQAAAPEPKIELESQDNHVETFLELESSETGATKPLASPATKPLSKRRAAHENKKRLVGVVVGGVLGLVIGYSLLCNIKPDADFLGIFRKSPVEEQTSPEHVVASPDTAKPVVGKPRPEPPPKKKPDPPKHEEKPKVKTPSQPVPSPMPTPAPDETDPFIDFGTTAELKPLSDTSPAVVGVFEAAERARIDQITLAEAATALAEGQKIQLEPVSGAEKKWRARVTGDSPIDIAEFFVDGRALKGQWTQQAAQTPAAEQLRNCLITVHVADKTRTLALRKPVKVEPLTLDMTKQINIQKIATDQPGLAMLPPVERLMIEVHTIDFPVHAEMKNDRKQAPFKASARETLAIGFNLEATDEKPEIRIKATQVKDALELRTESAVAGKEYYRDMLKDKEFDMTFAALKLRKQKAEVRQKLVEKDWRTLARDKAKLEEGIEKKKYTRNPQERVLLEQAKVRLATITQAYDAKDAELQHIKASLAAIDLEQSLSEKLHKTAKIYFRVFVKVGETEIELIRADD